MKKRVGIGKVYKQEGTERMRFAQYRKQFGVEDIAFDTPKESLGFQAEEFIYSALNQEVKLSRSTGKTDRLFGADFKVFPNSGGSFYVDVKLRTELGKGCSYLGHSNTTLKKSEALSFSFSFGRVTFGLKRRHHSFFSYEKPVILMYIDDFQFLMKEGEMKILSSILDSIQYKLISMGYQERASEIVYPNPLAFKQKDQG